MDRVISKPRSTTINMPTLWNAIEATRSSIIVTDSRQPDNPIVYCNQAFLDLTGYGREDVIGRNCRFMQGKDTSQQSINKLRNGVAKQQHVRVTIKNYRKDGQPFWNDLIMSPVFDEEGVLTNFVGQQLDVTDRVTYEEQLRKSQQDLLRSNKELEQFTYAASHDLQEPLRMVSSYLQLIKERYSGKLDEDGETFIGFAADGASRMQSLVNDLLTLSRVRTTARSFKPESLEALMDDALANLQTTISESGAKVTRGPLPKLPVERTQIIQLLQNLIGNAIKYRRPDRTPTVHVSAARKRGKYVISVRDNGIGIEPQYHGRIFGVFQRLHTRSEYPGTGVGLAICSKIVERHGGEIWVESEGDGEGATFMFTLPVRP